MKDSKLKVWGYDWVPDFAKGQVRDFRLRWALIEAGLSYDVDHVAMGTQGKPEHLARQPFGQVPVLEIDGAPMFESGAVVWRISETSEALLPPEIDRYAALSWVFAALNSVEPLTGVVGTVQTFVEDREAAERVAPTLRAMAGKKLKRLAGALGEKDYLLGDTFCVADLMMASVLHGLDGLNLIEDHPTLVTYRDRCLARPAYRKAMADQIAEIESNAAKYAR
ncbi:glutathione S-transferase family protein [Oceanicola sp. 502str15]|uniref:glutathione S-transferase family protein n=1 Tax=Oceanicola sp. 502str15 TaxID=2696061 RepID=UPI0020950A1C|nr:glutathione S-transferase family protein [Oceanicola sp. 502str15]MCO6384475.1 glutathione S-transferase family protein [Oceanicola sp. 502str15]